MAEHKVIFWDFDGTLAFREGLWSGTLAEVAQEQVPDLALEAAAFRPHLSNGFPWHRHEQAHTHLTTADHWWEELAPVFVQAYRNVGLPEAEAMRLAGFVRPRYVDPAGWRLYDDVHETLQKLSERGWQHAIISNHVPELADIVGALGLSSQFRMIINSAWVGYEKPHPEIFRQALAALDHPQSVWMVGDSLTADIAGAQALMINPILVRKRDESVPYNALHLQEILQIVEA